MLHLTLTLTSHDAPHSQPMATPDDNHTEAETHMVQVRKLLRQQAPVAEVLRVLKQHHPLPVEWASWTSQERMHRTLLCDPVHDIFPLAPWYRASFIRRLCLELEEAVAKDEECSGEVIEPIMRELNVLLCQPTLNAEPGELAAYFVTFECPVVVPMYVDLDFSSSLQEVHDEQQLQQPRKQILATRIAPKENAVGLKLWEACYVLTEALFSHPELCHGRDVIELGSGVGLLGLVAAYCLGAASVTMTDIDDKVLLFLRTNVEFNAAATASLLAADIYDVVHKKKERKGGEAAAAAVVPLIEVAAMDWSQPVEYKALLNRSPSSPSTTRKGVKQRDRIILAADCIYDREAIPAFVDVLAYSLQPPTCGSSRKTTVLVASTMRNPETYAHFEEVVKEKGLVMDDVTTMLGSLPPDPVSSHVSPTFYCPNRAAVRLCSVRLRSDEDENSDK